jgi:hypothetical protein
MRIWIRNTALFLANLRIADSDKEICRFAIFGLIITNFRICQLRSGTPQKFADLRFVDEQKNLRAHL